MTERLNFDTDEQPGEPIAMFTFTGREWTVKSVDDISYRLLERMAGIDPDDNVTVEAFFRAALVPDQVEDFVALLRNEDSPVSLGKIRKIMRGITEAIAGIPTTPSTT